MTAKTVVQTNICQIENWKRPKSSFAGSLPEWLNLSPVVRANRSKTLTVTVSETKKRIVPNVRLGYRKQLQIFKQATMPTTVTITRKGALLPPRAVQNPKRLPWLANTVSSSTSSRYPIWYATAHRHRISTASTEWSAAKIAINRRGRFMIQTVR